MLKINHVHKTLLNLTLVFYALNNFLFEIILTEILLNDRFIETLLSFPIWVFRRTTVNSERSPVFKITVK